MKELMAWKSNSSLRLGFLLYALWALTPAMLPAQEISGAITGTVTDPSGAVIPKAKVTATDALRGTVWPTESDSAGLYNFPRLPVGRYTVKVEAQGFATSVKPEFELQMNQIARIDFQLPLGATAQEIQVTSAPPLLQSDTMQVGLVTSGNLNENLPLATRNFIQLTLLTPGVTTVDPSSFIDGQRTGGGGRPYVNGNREEANNFLLDGVDNNQVSDNLTSYQPNVDAIEEFNVITNNAPAQYGQFQGGVISVTLKSGTDQYHGDVFEFMRNDVLNANNWGNNWAGVPKPAVRWNTFGGTLGGPIKKGKLFFFADYDAKRLDTPTSAVAYTVETPAERMGDYSALLNLATPVQLYSPCASLTGPCTAPANPSLPRQPYPGNIVTNTIDPVAAALYSSGAYPLPSNTNTQYNAYYFTRTFTNNDQGDLKVDYMLNDKNHIWGSYSQGFQQIPATNSVLLLGQSFDNSPFHLGVIDWTHTFSPTLVMDAKMGANRIYLNNGAIVSGLGDFATKLGIADGNPRGAGMPSLAFTNSLTSNLGSSDVEELFADTTVEQIVDFIWTHNRHVVHMGFQAMRHDINNYYSGNNGRDGFLAYTGQYTGGPNPASPVSSGYSDADFYLGLPEQIGLGINGGTWGQRSWVLAPYIQDDWRVTPQLTLNVGLRWEYNQPWYEVYNRQANFALIGGTEYFAGQSCPYNDCRALYNQDYRDWEPRLGFAYSPAFLGKSTVLRGAYTISSFMEGTGTNLRLPLNPPFQSETEANYTGVAAPFTAYFPGSTTDQGFSTVSAPANPFSNAVLRVWDPNVQPAITEQWNFALEHQFPSQMLLSVGYVGQHGTHLMVPTNYEQGRIPGEAGCPSSTVGVCNSLYLNSTLVNETAYAGGTASNGKQTYDALQVSLSKHMTQGLEFQLSYTYQKGMTNNIGYYGQGGQASTGGWYSEDIYNMKAEWGPTYFNDTQLLTLSYVYQLPFGAGKKYGSSWNAATKGVLGNWQLSGIYSAHTGFPMTVYATDLSGTYSFAPRANCTGPVTYTHGVGPDTTWFNTSPFAQPAAGTFGNCANGTVIGPGLDTWDFGIGKRFPVTESKHVEFRAEFINFLNHPIFNSPAFMNVNSTPFGEITSSQGERNIQFALKFYF